jgi:UDP-N-acetylmuramate dehydrogenase
MELQNILTDISSILTAENILVNEPMKKHTTFKIGGNADAFLTPQTIEQIQQLIHLFKANNIPYYVIGNGSNLLVSDEGIRGVVIQLGDQFSAFEILHDDCKSAVDKNNCVYIRTQAGMMLGRLGGILAGYSLAGFEFATGIPGTVGGAVMMNAGAYGGEIKDIIVKATVMDQDGHIFELSKDELELGYRTSVIVTRNLIVLDAYFRFHAGSKDEIMDKIKELALKRRTKQPLEFPSAGSTFKRPTGYFAGKLISDAGLRGLTVGDAQVSEKHAGFVINLGNATAQDVIDLTEKVKKKVYELNGVELELEIRKLGFN